MPQWRNRLQKHGPGRAKHLDPSRPAFLRPRWWAEIDWAHQMSYAMTPLDLMRRREDAARFNEVVEFYRLVDHDQYLASVANGEHVQGSQLNGSDADTSRRSGYWQYSPVPFD